jgi:hypothetical protein
MTGECGYRCISEERIRTLEQNHAETKVYVKEIKEDLTEIKADIKKRNENESKAWSPVILELIKALTTAITVIGAIVGALKFTGK